MKIAIKDPRVLIAVPSFHLAEYVQKLLPTIKCKTPYALCLIDNGSNDEVTELFKKEALKDNVFAIICEDNRGASGAWNMALNFGFEMKDYEIVVILNNDTLLYPDTIDRIIYGLRQGKGGLVTATNIAGGVADETEFFKLGLRGADFYEESPDFSCFGISVDCFRKIGYFDEAIYPAYFEDNDYHYRMKLEGIKAVRNTGNYYYHYGSRTKLNDLKFADYMKWRFVKNGEYYIQKWGGDRGEETYKEPFDGKAPEQIKIQKYEDYRNEIDHLNPL